jgi:hypothetical protein
MEDRTGGTKKVFIEDRNRGIKKEIIEESIGGTNRPPSIGLEEPRKGSWKTELEQPRKRS